MDALELSLAQALDVKEPSVHHEDVDERGCSPLDTIAERRLIRKIDLRLITLSTLIYMLCFIDRSNMGNARILNDDTGDSLQQSLKLTNKQYSITLAVFYISYLLFDTPSTYLLKRYKPSRWFTLLMLLWSATTMSIAGVRNYHGLIVTRFLLGLFECGIFPGLVYCLTFWYKPDERAFRVAIISTGAIIGGAFGGALAFGVGTINRAAGLQGWRWLFLIEGLPPIALAPFIFYFFPDYPETSHWLSPSERALATARIQGVGSLGHAKLTWADARNALLDGRLYLHHVMLISNAVPFSSISLFAPTIVRGLGFEGLRAQLFAVPPYAIALGVAMSTAWLADRYEARSLVAIAGYLACGVCFLIQGVLPTTAFTARYTLLCLAIPCAYSMGGPQASWLTGNLRNTGETTLIIPLNASISNLGQIIGLFVFKDSESPGFPTGHFTITGFMFFGATLAMILRYVYVSRNRKLSPGELRWRL